TQSAAGRTWNPYACRIRARSSDSAPAGSRSRSTRSGHAAASNSAATVTACASAASAAGALATAATTTAHAHCLQQQVESKSSALAFQRGGILRCHQGFRISLQHRLFHAAGSFLPGDDAHALHLVLLEIALDSAMLLDHVRRSANYTQQAAISAHREASGKRHRAQSALGELAFQYP